MENMECVRQNYLYLSQGNMAAVWENFHPEIIWEECSGFPFISDNGISIGRQVLEKNVFIQLARRFDAFSIEVQELFACGEKVVMVGHYLGKHKNDGQSFKANAVHVWTFSAGKVIRFFQAVDTHIIQI